LKQKFADLATPRQFFSTLRAMNRRRDKTIPDWRALICGGNQRDVVRITVITSAFRYREAPEQCLRVCLENGRSAQSVIAVPRCFGRTAAAGCPPVGEILERHHVANTTRPAPEIVSDVLTREMVPSG